MKNEQICSYLNFKKGLNLVLSILVLCHAHVPSCIGWVKILYCEHVVGLYTGSINALSTANNLL